MIRVRSKVMSSQKRFILSIRFFYKIFLLEFLKNILLTFKKPLKINFFEYLFDDFTFERSLND